MRALSFYLLLISALAYGQQAEPVLFRERSFDFGDVQIGGGTVEHEFQFTNNSPRPVRIVSVQASCGCTTPGWTKDAVPPQGTGFVKASFDPKGRPGYFNKSLTVTTDYDGNAITLQIKGEVTEGSGEAVDFPAANGSLRLKYNSFSLGKIYINRKPSSKAFEIYNGSDKPVRITGAIGAPPYIKVEIPAQLPPRQVTTIGITYDARARNQYGFVTENISIPTDDVAMPVKSFSVYATIEEYFSELSAAELAEAPVMELGFQTVDMGRVRTGNTISRDVLIKNTGKKDLHIKAVQSNCSCVGAVLSTRQLRSGEEGKLTISLRTEGRTGIQQKAVTLYSDDPRSPVQRVTLTGYVEQ